MEKKKFLTHNISLDTNALLFQYKVLDNILFENKMLFKFGKATSSLCSFCKLHDETIIHLFYDYLIVKLQIVVESAEIYTIE